VWIGLVFGVLTRLSALGIGLLSLSFFIAKAIVLSQGRGANCGCFGAFGDTLASVTIFLDLPMMILAMVVMWRLLMCVTGKLWGVFCQRRGEKD